MRPRPKKSSAHAASNATRRILRQCHFATPYGSPMALRDTIRLTYGASRHTARATPMAPLWGRHTAPPHGYARVACGNAASIRRACALCSRCLRQRGEHTRALKAPHWGTFFAYGAPLGTPYGSAARLCSRCLRQRGEHMPCAFNRLQSPFCRRN